MALLSFLFGNKPKSAGIAKERLKLIIAHQRGDSSGPPDYLPALQKELMEVISKYIKVDPADINVNIEKQGNVEMLEVNIVLSGRR